MTEFFKSVVLEDLAQTQLQARTLASQVKQGDLVLLEGPLGVGKTAFMQAFLQAWVENPALVVPSPTFNLVLTYEGPRGVAWHADLYRLEMQDPKLLELGLEEACWQALVCIEWPDRLGEAYLAQHDPLWICLDFVPDAPEQRILRYKGSSKWQQRLGEES